MENQKLLKKQFAINEVLVGNIATCMDPTLPSHDFAPKMVDTSTETLKPNEKETEKSKK